MILLIWLLGIIPSYIFFRWLFQHELSHNWDNIVFKSFLSIIWPASFLYMAIFAVSELNPPKWL